ncbi:MAG: hypothetical protein ACE5IL_12145 [Myxococcota bacterium]
MECVSTAAAPRPIRPYFRAVVHDRIVYGWGQGVVVVEPERPARTTIQAGALPLGLRLEIDAIAAA